MNVGDWLLVLGISLANNLDNTGVGVAYGAGRIRLSIPVNLWISMITFLITGSATFFGDRAAFLLSPHVSKTLSAVILCAIGVFVMRPSLVRRAKAPESAVSTPSTLSTEPAGADLLHILEDPTVADRDGSRHIDYKEGTLLGVALSINNIGGGVSAGLVHLSVFWTAFSSAVLSFLVLWLGGLLGRRLSAGRTADRAPLVAGALLIIIGLLQFR